MSNEIKISHRLLAVYFNTIADLCASLEYDLKNGNKITSKTVNQLSKVISAGNKITNFIDAVTKDEVELN